MGTNELLTVELTDDEIRVLRHGLLEWGGPARCTERMALAMGFESVDDLWEQGKRIRQALADRQPLSQRDWVRTLLATEVVFASDVMGSGFDWEATSGLSDADTIRLLRSAQGRFRRRGRLTCCFGLTAKADRTNQRYCRMTGGPATSYRDDPSGGRRPRGPRQSHQRAAQRRAGGGRSRRHWSCG